MLNITNHQENADQKHIELSHLLEWLSLEREHKWRERGEKQYGTPLMRIWTCIAIGRDSMEIPQEIKIRTTILVLDSAILLLGYISEGNENHYLEEISEFLQKI